MKQKNHLSEIDTEITQMIEQTMILKVMIAVFQMFKKLIEYLNVLRGSEDIKNNQIQILEIKNIISEIQNTLDKI